MKIGGTSCSFCTSTIGKAYSRIDGCGCQKPDRDVIDAVLANNAS